MSSTLYAVGVGSTILGGITQQNLVTGSQVRGEGSSAEIYARIASLVEQKVATGFTTQAIAAALAACGITGSNIGDLTGGLALYAQLREDGGTFTSGSTHRKFSFSNGVLYPTQFNCQHRGDATLGYAAAISYGGTYDPVVVTDSSALPSLATNQKERFTLGPVTIGSVTIEDLRSIGINFGIKAEGEGSDSDIWDTIASIRAIRPVITITGIDPEWLAAANIPLAGKAATHANTTIYLRKRAEAGTFVADATAEHVKITAAGLAVIENAFDASGEETGTTSLQLTCVYDGTNAPMVIDTASAIT